MTGLFATALLTIVVHNLASVPDDELTAAQSGVERLLTGSGVALAWVKIAHPQAFTVQLVVRPQPDNAPKGRSPFVLGTTIGEDHSSGGSCCVFYERVMRFAHTIKRPVVAILALVIAHELGHVLLPAPAHTISGLMKAEWSEDDIRHFTLGDAPFSAAQFGLMRAAIANEDSASPREVTSAVRRSFESK